MNPWCKPEEHRLRLVDTLMDPDSGKAYLQRWSCEKCLYSFVRQVGWV